MPVGYLQQLVLFLKKNALVQWRSPWTLISQFILAFLVLLLVFVFDRTLVTQPLFTALENITDLTPPDCPDFMTDCVDLYVYSYDPTNPLFSQTHVQELTTQLQQQYPDQTIRLMTDANFTEESFDKFLFAKHLNYVTALLIHPSISDSIEGASAIIRYAVLVNPHLTVDSHRAYMPYAWFTQQFILQTTTGKPVKIDFSYQRLPNLDDETARAELLANGSSPYFFVIFLVNFIVFLNLIVGEKENGQRIYAKIVGAYDSIYWLAHFIQNMAITFVLSWFVIGIGAAFQFRLFLHHNVFALFLVFWAFTFGLTCFAFFVATLLSKTRIAITLSVSFFVIGMIFQLISETPMIVDAIFDNFAYTYIVIFGFFPPFFFGTAMSGFTKRYDYGFALSDLVEDIPDSSVFCPLYSMLLIIALGVVWVIIGTIIMISSQSENGWLFEVLGYKALKQLAKKYIRDDDEDEDRDEDVAQEELSTLKEDNQLPMRLYNVRKTFHNRWPYKTRDDVNAVRGVTLSVEEGTVFTLLGHNGAGKSTLIKIMTGQHIPSHGRIFMGGVDLAADLAYVRQHVGLCPQNDIIFETLTGREHLRFYGQLKGLHGLSLETEIESLLSLVSLQDAGDKQVGNYSGGMKRRLSVAIACIASPKCLILDEPTTGMDPVTRREVWRVIEKIKQKRTVLLTTHYMDEAEVLSDKIAIMAKGKIQCIGSSVHLKSKFGTGYVLTLNCDPHDVEEVETEVCRTIENVKVIQRVSGKLKLGIEYAQAEALHDCIKRLEQHEIPVINWGVSPSNLEEVFLACTGSNYRQNEDVLEVAKYLDGTYNRDDMHADRFEVLDDFEMDDFDSSSSEDKEERGSSSEEEEDGLRQEMIGSEEKVEASTLMPTPRPSPYTMNESLLQDHDDAPFVHHRSSGEGHPLAIEMSTSSTSSDSTSSD